MGHVTARNTIASGTIIRGGVPRGWIRPSCSTNCRYLLSLCIYRCPLTVPHFCAHLVTCFCANPVPYVRAHPDSRNVWLCVHAYLSIFSNLSWSTNLEGFSQTLHSPSTIFARKVNTPAVLLGGKEIAYLEKFVFRSDRLRRHSHCSAHAPRLHSTLDEC